MLTKEQEEQALKIYMETQIKELEKQSRAKHHMEAVKAVTKYNLPYRVYLKYEYLEGEVHINPFYPFPAVPKEGAWHWWMDFRTRKEYFDAIMKRTGEYTEEGKEICEINTGEGSFIDELKTKHEAPFCIWNLDTEEGFAIWKKYFVRFLLPYEEDMKHWKAFDFFGTVDHTEEEAEERRKYYLGLIDEYKSDPDEYHTERIMKKLEDYDLYCVGLYYMRGLPFEEEPTEEVLAKEKEYEEYLQQSSKEEGLV